MRYIRNFKSINSSKKATLYSAAMIKVAQNDNSVSLMKDVNEKDAELCVIG